MRKILIGRREVRVIEYRDESLARQAASRPGWRLIMGDCPIWWVCRPADAERLARAGYEYAR